MNIITLLTAIKEISNTLENYKETKDELFLKKVEEGLDKLYLKIVERIQI